MKSAFVLALFVVCFSTVSAEEAVKAVRLNNDAKYEARLNEALAAKLSETATDEQKVMHFFKLASAEADMRHYDKAEAYARKAVDLYPQWSFTHAALSVYLGKQGKYKEAAAEAQTAIEQEKEYPTYPNLIMASWEFHLGKKEEALRRVESLKEPENAFEKRSYYGCLACFYASVGDEEKIANAIKKAKALDTRGSLLPFLERDIILDPYRGKTWFIELAGKTLAEETK